MHLGLSPREAWLCTYREIAGPVEAKVEAAEKANPKPELEEMSEERVKDTEFMRNENLDAAQKIEAFEQMLKQKGVDV